MSVRQLTIQDITFTFHDYTTAEYDQVATILTDKEQAFLRKFLDTKRLGDC